MNPYLVTQLRNAHDNGALCREAADEIERLRAARVHLLLDLRDAMRALTDFVRLTDPCPSCGGVRAQPRIASTGLRCDSTFHDDPADDAIQPTVTQHADGRMKLNWGPDRKPDYVKVAPEVLEALIARVNGDVVMGQIADHFNAVDNRHAK